MSDCCQGPSCAGAPEPTGPGAAAGVPAQPRNRAERRLAARAARGGKR